MLNEHSRDGSFQLWSNQFKKEYEVIPLKEYEYCMGLAEEGGHAQYKTQISPDIDLKRDVGQSGMSVSSFMHNYLNSIAWK